MNTPAMTTFPALTPPRRRTGALPRAWSRSTPTGRLRKDVEKGFESFTAYYKANYLSHMPADRDARILVVSCGPGYLVNMLRRQGYRNVLGIDSDASKVEYARRRHPAVRDRSGVPVPVRAGAPSTTSSSRSRN